MSIAFYFITILLVNRKDTKLTIKNKTKKKLVKIFDIVGEKPNDLKWPTLLFFLQDETNETEQ